MSTPSHRGRLAGLVAAVLLVSSAPATHAQELSQDQLQDSAESAGYDVAGDALGSALGSSFPSIGSSTVGEAAVTPDFTPAHVVEKRHLSGNEWEVDIYSPSNDLIITNTLVMAEGNEPRPNVVLLPGLGGGENEHWSRDADLPGYFAGQHVNVLSVHGGAGTMFTDWVNEHPEDGRVAWATCLGQELPLVLEQELYGNGKNAIAGISMSGGPALDIAGRYPESYVATASLSGFPASSGVFGWGMLGYVTMAHGGTPIDVWGDVLNPAWQDHDPAETTQRLRGKAVFVGHATGKPGEIDKMNDNDPFLVTISEMMSAASSEYYMKKARADGVDVDYVVLPEGRHTFGVFEALLHEAWETTLAEALLSE
ncbi:alpha/beta hydrolase [Corynebacterium lubricantis]|uniref:alpha/beta hydrolase n=1 Tax=Corynebacterium lubricantis TaxID=541095 RepID=UPI0003A4B684|nr:alpha/beta hydrolase-fold protein [Corynebacterium lubricantis]